MSETECKVFDPGPDKWDLDTLSLVSQLMNGFHGVNGTAAVSLTGVTCREHQKRFMTQPEVY